MAQLLLQGTNSVNFLGRFAWVGLAEVTARQAIAVTEREDLKRVIGSVCMNSAYPDYYRAHSAVSGSSRKPTTTTVMFWMSNFAGEYLYAACGEEGFIAYDVATSITGFQRAHPHRAGVAARAAVLREDEIRHQRLLAEHPRARSDRRAWPRTRKGPIHLMFASLRHG